MNFTVKLCQVNLLRLNPKWGSKIFCCKLLLIHILSSGINIMNKMRIDYLRTSRKCMSIQLTQLKTLSSLNGQDMSAIYRSNCGLTQPRTNTPSQKDREDYLQVINICKTYKQLSRSGIVPVARSLESQLQVFLSKRARDYTISNLSCHAKRILTIQMNSSVQMNPVAISIPGSRQIFVEPADICSGFQYLGQLEYNRRALILSRLKICYSMLFF